MNLDLLIQNSVARFADRPAMEDGRTVRSYAQLDERVNRLGTGLLGLGLALGTRIASLQFNSIETLEIELLASRFGFVRTLLNARNEASDFEYALNHCGARALFFSDRFTPVVEQLRERLTSVQVYVCIGDAPSWAVSYEDLIASAKNAPPAYEVGEDDWHSIYYTSGTTGRPKGVVLSQRNWLVLIRNHLVGPFHSASQDDVVLHAAPMSHASGALALSHFLRGARQIALPKFSAPEVLETIERQRVTTTFLAPTMIHLLLQHEDHGKTDKSSLKTVVYGGAPMIVEHLRQVLAEWGPVLLQGYGQWEAPQLFTYLDQQQHAEALDSGQIHRLGSAGMPISFCGVGIMDDEGRLLPPGSDGEVVTCGDHLMVGYLDNEAATSEIRHGKWQRTGDIGHMDADGFLYLTDRKKDVIITGGSNVYPREIEEVIHTHPEVLEAIAIGIPDDKWGERVHALVVSRSGDDFDVDSFISWCGEKLSPDRRPRSVERLPELPKTAYGKIMRRELREKYWENRDRKI
ncbi:AMP-binding protein [Oceanibacterium hippocampi]|uniref:Long-chain-fatty-acid--CoA ligase n=1 Tax=Oceanibacterium hippocampi TaxID=745714 RepID=A0A1Y5TYA4_9PROT|nr:AMP-binding protein [Oceanibacterium hippocampi]SLN71062.1 Long-chain-fatty-acid--CoA ligase [Oceanibacterium hippocampi]